MVDKTAIVLKSMDIAWEILRTEIDSRPPDKGWAYLTPENVAMSFNDVFLIIVGTVAAGMRDLDERLGKEDD